MAETTNRTPHFKPADLRAMSYDELSDLRATVELDVLQIKDSLTKAKNEVITEGRYADPDWYRRATFAAKAKGRLLQMLQAEMGRKKRSLHAANALDHKSWAECFVTVARRMLEKGVFDHLADLTREEQSGTPDGVEAVLTVEKVE